MRRTGHIRQRSAGSWEIRYPLPGDRTGQRRLIATATIRGDRRAAEKALMLA